MVINSKRKRKRTADNMVLNTHSLTVSTSRRVLVRADPAQIQLPVASYPRLLESARAQRPGPAVYGGPEYGRRALPGRGPRRTGRLHTEPRVDPSAGGVARPQCRRTARRSRENNPRDGPFDRGLPAEVCLRRRH